ncbi:MAG TPA: adenylyl-sulfate kinase [Anaeromyxobacteraceae bacterium]|nr:adenylyl-sulfate kinase [Anaeromyxobacteraceae bacterium]
MTGAVIWIDGLPSSGKSTLAQRAVRRLAAAGARPLLLDGDAVRAAIEPAPGYDVAARDAFYRTLARLAGLVARQGFLAVVAATAPRRAHRAFARGVAPRLVEVFVDVPLEECMRRDAKGLYARARAGDVATLPGAGEPYEAPEAPDIVARGGEDEEALERLAALVGPRT